MNLKKTAVGTVAVLAALALGGCGSATDLSGGQGATLTKQDFAASLSAATKDARSVHMTGSFAVQGQRVTMSADESMGGASLGDVAAAMTMDVAGMGSVEMRIVSGAVYIDTSKLSLPTGSDKPWLKVDLTDPKNPLGATFGQLAAMNPAELSKAFESITTLTPRGTETVDGTPTTHYTVSVDTAKASSLFGVPAGASGPSLPKSISYDVWVDGDNRPVQITLHNPAVTVDLHFSNWGEPVRVTAPPASEVGELSL